MSAAGKLSNDYPWRKLDIPALAVAVRRACAIARLPKGERRKRYFPRDSFDRLMISSLLIGGVARARRINSSRFWCKHSFSWIVVMVDDNIKTYPVVPGGNIQLESLPLEANEAKDAAMGRYMDAFSSLEGMIHLATGLILQIDLTVLGSVFATLMTKQSIDLLDAVAQEHLTEEGASRVHKLCERLGRRNMRRNHIVHGAWVQCLIISEEVATQEWVRCYNHVNPALRKLPYTDPKVAGTYTFTIPELNKATGYVQEMREAVSALIGDLPSLRLPLPVRAELTGA